MISPLMIHGICVPINKLLIHNRVGILKKKQTNKTRQQQQQQQHFTSYAEHFSFTIVLQTGQIINFREHHFDRRFHENKPSRNYGAAREKQNKTKLAVRCSGAVSCVARRGSALRPVQVL